MCRSGTFWHPSSTPSPPLRHAGSRSVGRLFGTPRQPDESSLPHLAPQSRTVLCLRFPHRKAQEPQDLGSPRSQSSDPREERQPRAPGLQPPARPYVPDRGRSQRRRPNLAERSPIHHRHEGWPNPRTLGSGWKTTGGRRLLRKPPARHAGRTHAPRTEGRHRLNQRLSATPPQLRRRHGLGHRPGPAQAPVAENAFQTETGHHPCRAEHERIIAAEKNPE